MAKCPNEQDVSILYLAAAIPEKARENYRKIFKLYANDLNYSDSRQILACLMGDINESKITNGARAKLINLQASIQAERDRSRLSHMIPSSI